MMNYDRNLVESEKRRYQLPECREEGDNRTLILVGVLLVIMLLILLVI